MPSLTFVSNVCLLCSAAEIVRNLGTLVPKGALVYISTDDPQGVCNKCAATFSLEDPSWDPFRNAGWEIRFLKDYEKRSPALQAIKPWLYGIVEALVCARAKVFAGTYLSTYSGFIHLIRGYHGLGEASFYHTPGHRNDLRSSQNQGEGWPREWRYGWTDDEGEDIRRL